MDNLVQSAPVDFTIQKLTMHGSSRKIFLVVLRVYLLLTNVVLLSTNLKKSTYTWSHQHPRFQ